MYKFLNNSLSTSCGNVVIVCVCQWWVLNTQWWAGVFGITYCIITHTKRWQHQSTVYQSTYLHGQVNYLCINASLPSPQTDSMSIYILPVIPSTFNISIDTSQLETYSIYFIHFFFTDYFISRGAVSSPQLVIPSQSLFFHSLILSYVH